MTHHRVLDERERMETYTRLTRAAALLLAESEALSREAKRVLRKNEREKNRRKTNVEIAGDQAAEA